jgi:hypothetical protein
MAVAVVAVGAAEHEWRFVLVRRELLLCSEQGVKAVSRMSVVWKCD